MRYVWRPRHGKINVFLRTRLQNPDACVNRSTFFRLSRQPASQSLVPPQQHQSFGVECEPPELRGSDCVRNSERVFDSIFSFVASGTVVVEAFELSKTRFGHCARCSSLGNAVVGSSTLRCGAIPQDAFASPPSGSKDTGCSIFRICAFAVQFSLIQPSTLPAACSEQTLVQ